MPEEEFEYLEEYKEKECENEIEYLTLLEMVQENTPEVSQLKEIQRSDYIVYKQTVDIKIHPFCRVAVCNDYPGIVSYFLVAIFFKNEWCFYHSMEW